VAEGQTMIGGETVIADLLAPAEMMNVPDPASLP
jgi:hypothetical protein